MTLSSSRDKLRELRHVALDMDGTIYRGGQLFDTTRPFLKLLDHLAIGYTFVTNNCSHAREEYVARLARFGIEVVLEQIVTSADATITYLAKLGSEIGSIYVIGTPALKAALAGAGFQIATGKTEPGLVVVGFDTALLYDDLCRACFWIGRGKRFVATHPDTFCPTDRPTVLVDCGAVCACITASTGCEPEVVVGKPDPRILAPVLERHGLVGEQVAVVGDRLYTDIELARRAGAFGVKVLTGDRHGEDDPEAPEPDLIVPGLAEFGEAIAASRA